MAQGEPSICAMFLGFSCTLPGFKRSKSAIAAVESFLVATRITQNVGDGFYLDSVDYFTLYARYGTRSLPFVECSGEG
jgi:hypothetical protein